MDFRIVGGWIVVTFAVVGPRAHAQWSLNGSEIFYQAGNVGINTTDPAYPLDVRSTASRVVFGYATSTSGTADAVYGWSRSTSGRGLVGYSSAGSGYNYGVYGRSNSSKGRGVFGYAASSTGTTIGVYGKVNSPNGYAGYFSGNVGVTGWIGTKADAPIQLYSRNHQVWKAQSVQNLSERSVNIIGGCETNSIGGSNIGSTIAGGGGSSSLDGGTGPNVINADYGFIGGGVLNQALSNYGVVGGGYANSAEGTAGFVGGGTFNHAEGSRATIGGGEGNLASGTLSSVPGGSDNTAAGSYSFAAGRNAHAAHAGSFVWADSTNAVVSTSLADQFVVRASNGLWFGSNSNPSNPVGRFINTSSGAHLTTGGAWTNASSAHLKENLKSIDPPHAREILERVASLPIWRWNYKAENAAVRHIGPTSQDFVRAFGVGADDESIATVDADGVALAAIQGLRLLLSEREQDIESLKTRVNDQRRMLVEQHRLLEELSDRLKSLESGRAEPR